ncbi:uncharacterized protein BDW43DRAFT_301709 [Aspergillus alliaceus]|uniref:uncharacterized protein n=1 Tax=Petromyces alliaceus TaxID=209559 RepID=UPI0012A470E8|nr:uncharacterized protein BDW43DRAFT_301709 [Aspergillus alliaceus]KAB8231516.1 hypothetical protein BDW43DRAFT_301709 [Aspergillus alliaceus]
MEAFDLSKAPPEFQAWGTTIWTLNGYSNLTWLYVYYGMIYRSMKDKSYAMPLISQCLNIAWEITFGYIYVDHWVVYSTFLIAFRHLLTYYIVGTLVALAGHLCATAELGPTKACFVNAIVLQVIISVGYLGMLFVRGSTRGFSMDLGFFRFIGSLALVPEFYLRVKYWPENFAFLGKPFMLWCCACFLGFDLIYGVCFWYMRQQERERERQIHMQKGAAAGTEEKRK